MFYRPQPLARELLRQGQHPSNDRWITCNGYFFEKWWVLTLEHRLKRTNWTRNGTLFSEELAPSFSDQNSVAQKRLQTNILFMRFFPTPTNALSTLFIQGSIFFPAAETMSCLMWIVNVATQKGLEFLVVAPNSALLGLRGGVENAMSTEAY